MEDSNCEKESQRNLVFFLARQRSDVWLKALAVLGDETTLMVAVSSLGIKMWRVFEDGSIERALNRRGDRERNRDVAKAILKLHAENPETDWTPEAAEAAVHAKAVLDTPDTEKLFDFDPQEILKAKSRRLKDDVKAIRGRLKHLGPLADSGGWSGQEVAIGLRTEQEEALPSAELRLEEHRRACVPMAAYEHRARFWGECDHLLRLAGWDDRDIADLVEELHLVFPSPMGEQLAEEFFGNAGKTTERIRADRVKEVRSACRKIAKTKGGIWNNNWLDAPKTVTQDDEPSGS